MFRLTVKVYIQTPIYKNSAMVEQKSVPKPGDAGRQKKNYNVAFVKRVIKTSTGGQYRVSKEVAGIVADEVEKYISSVAQDAAMFAMNAGRCTIKPKDVQAVLSIRK